MKDILSAIIQNKISLMILAAVIFIGSFEVWKWNQEKYQKFLSEQKMNCQREMETADKFIKNSETLLSLQKSPQYKSREPIAQPGITREFEPGLNYILMYNEPHVLIPEAGYKEPFFQSLHKLAKQPYPLFVYAEKSSGNKAKVFTKCSPKPFEVFTKNLYNYIQPNDFTIR